VSVGKRCPGCGRDDVEFGPNRRQHDGLQPYCRTCQREKANAWRKANPKRRNAHRIKSMYGLTQADFDAMLHAQQGRCGICDTELVSLRIDHDHKTGAVRELLCHRCNIGLASLEDHDWVRRAMLYLNRHNRKDV
jgi:hypothetical protein